MLSLMRTDASHHDFEILVQQLDVELAQRDGEEHAFYAQYNTLDKIKYVIIAYEHDNAVACGAIKEFSPEAMEVKRMYTLPQARGKGMASRILGELESWAKELAYVKCVLETGKRQSEAIRLYEKNGYSIIPNYGQYVKMENSLCFEKIL
ncbi:putative acetyltransferase [Catalinimonas alkaloidigena]|uniref:GNAT family N-acetyltransferase n=1 Tax=Catalinimonas alkaloidigena TaxID=1075417 RepID=UPI002405A2FE|nr:GNAT family N-acetyltransferase [Catalinimonas alkaloidigena]MDF9798065.1 putative acetyltransferase [Catalinimonas alkaloidigena]